MKIPEAKYSLLAEGDEEVNKITKMYRRGLMTDEERHNKVISVWEKIDDKITKALIDNLGTVQRYLYDGSFWCQRF